VSAAFVVSGTETEVWIMRSRVVTVGVVLAVVAVVVIVPAAGRRPSGVVAASEVAEKTLLDNERMTMIELVFPAGFKGEEHSAVADELAYVLEGEFAVVTKGQGKRVLRRGEVEYASKGTVHYSLNETRQPARVLVVLLKSR
jgi:quercetin dioxygenase-like cupin family protein